MRIKHNLIFGVSFNEIIELLKRSFPSTNMRSNSFVLYMSTAPMRYHHLFLFRITGTIHQEMDGTKISYTIQPVSAGYGAALFLAIGLIVTIISLLKNISSIASVAIAFVINMLYWVLLISQQRECLTTFEQKLKTGGQQGQQGQGDGLREL